MTDFFDALEARSPDEREAALMAALPAQVAAAQRTPAFGALFAGVEPRDITSREALAALPVTRKHELLERQRRSRAANASGKPGDPFGGHSAVGWRALGLKKPARRVFQSPGPIYEPQGSAGDFWRLARALHAAGVRPGDLLHNAFGYHLTPAGAMVEAGAHAIGCTVFPGGVGNTELQLQAMRDLRPDAWAGTPGFLRILLDKAAEAGIALPSLRKATVGGEAFPAALRDAIAAHGVAALQVYASADCGCIAYETAARDGLVVDEGVVVEVVRPGSGDPVDEGEVGEVVVTLLDPDYPLVRFGTGDLSAWLPGACPTGRTNRRLGGWMGRADQTAKVRGMFVHPGHVAELMRRHPALRRARLVVDGGGAADDRLTLRAECEDAGIAGALADTLRELTRLRGGVEIVPPATLPDDGRLVDDRRPPPS